MRDVSGLHTMLSPFTNVVTFSKRIMKHEAVSAFWGNFLSYAPRRADTKTCCIGWGNKRNTAKARQFSDKHKIPYFRLEDGFIRSVGLGIKKSPPFSLIIDDLGIYYDATKPSRLEEILNHHQFSDDIELMKQAREAMALIRQFKISKYNAARDITDEDIVDNNNKKILVIAQTAGDMSLRYGLTKRFSTRDIVDAAFQENPGADIYLKIHPDVIAGKKKSDLDVSCLPPECKVITKDINPVSLLEKFDKVYTKTSQMGFEAILLGKECVCFGMPFYAGWGITDDRVQCQRRNRTLTPEEVFAGAYILYTRYYNPYVGKESDIIDTLYTIKRYREIEQVNGGTLLFYGFPPWKQFYHRHFFKSYHRNQFTFCYTLKKIKALAKRPHSRFMIWGKKYSNDIAQFIQTSTTKTFHVEDGFIRSVSLGSNLTMPYSLVVDSRGLYIDPSQESDLEHIYNTYNFQGHSGLLERTKKVIKHIVEARLSKYNFSPHGDELEIDRDKYDKIILIPGQVSDDASIILGGYNMDNLSLLQKVKEQNPDSYIIYKPHPDVVAGNREGNIPNDQLLQYCNKIITDISIDSCINWSDEIHTITSLTGFDAILRDKKVVTYGMPFYAGWGITKDYRTCSRRTRQLTKEELVAGALLLYPRYVHPSRKEYCEIELALEEIKKEQERYNNSIAYKKVTDLRNKTISTSRKLIARNKYPNAN